MPSLSVRAFAEMLNLPAYEQQRILIEQKYPRQEPQAFKIPYYQPALRGLRAYYNSGNSHSELTNARSRVRTLKLDSRIQHNLRVINAFARSRQAQRPLQLEPQSIITVNAAVNVDLRLKFDLFAQERNSPKRIFYNFRNVPIDPGIARLTLEVSHWVLDQNHTPIAFNALEYVDLESGNTIRVNRIGARTIRMIAANAKIISTLWPTL